MIKLKPPRVSFLVVVFAILHLGPITAQPVNKEMYVSIGGIQQWITISGADRSKPVILFIHGGPGSVLSPYAEKIFERWRSEFVLVNWDQRGAGRTFGKNAPAEVDESYWLANPLTLNQLTEDGIELSRYLLESLGKEKLILVGTSWGSILGTSMTLTAPELFHLYVGHAQFVSFNENMASAYLQTLELAEKAGDTASVNLLKSLDMAPYENARSTGQFLRVVKKYENDHSNPAPEAWWEPAASYANEEDSRDRYNGDDYSFLYFAGHKALGIEPMAGGINFSDTGTEIKIPVILVQGEFDILTAGNLNKSFFDLLQAPEKSYIVVPGAGHGFNQAVIDTMHQVLADFIENNM